MITNSKSFLNAQYGDSSNLDIRIRLHEMYSTNSDDWHEWVFDHIAFGETSRIVEFGCGSGALWGKNKSRMNGGWKLLLTDMSGGMLQKAQATAGEADQDRLTYRIADIQHTQLESGIYDIAIANHMLYHVPEIGKALTEVRRILKPSGSFYAATNGLRHMIELYDLVREFDSSLAFAKPENAIAFGMENGGALLQSHFGQVRLLPFESDLHVTSASDLAAYMFSVGSHLREAIERDGRLADFLEFLESKKNEQGYIHITKQTGLFICTQPKSV